MAEKVSMNVIWVKGGCAGPPRPKPEEPDPLKKMLKAELIELAESKGIETKDLTKDELIKAIEAIEKSEE